MNEPMTPASARRGCYQMALVPCLGPAEAERLVMELDSGLASLRRHRSPDARAREGVTP